MRKLTEEEKERVVFTECVGTDVEPISPSKWGEIWDTGDGYLLGKDCDDQYLYKGYLKEEWKPKYKELVLMSCESKKWFPRFFHSMKGDEFLDGFFDSEMNFIPARYAIWKYCKPYKHDNKDN